MRKEVNNLGYVIADFLREAGKAPGGGGICTESVGGRGDGGNSISGRGNSK